jgi:hypothetical protein
VPYSCKSASSTVTVFNRIYISPSFHISFILISQFFFDRSNCPYLIVRRPFTLTVRRLYVQSVTLILHLCIVSRLGSAARHHTFFLNASIYDVSSFLPLPPHQQFPYNVYMYQRYFLPSRIYVQVVPIQCAIQYCDQRFDNTVIYSVGSRHYENDSL